MNVRDQIWGPESSTIDLEAIGNDAADYKGRRGVGVGNMMPDIRKYHIKPWKW